MMLWRLIGTCIFSGFWDTRAGRKTAGKTGFPKEGGALKVRPQLYIKPFAAALTPFVFVQMEYRPVQGGFFWPNVYD